MLVRFSSIVWETDGEALGLPSEVVLDVDVEDEAVLHQEAANILSDHYGFLVKECSYEILKTTEAHTTSIRSSEGRPVVGVPLTFYILAGRVGPTEEQAQYLQRKEWYGGLLDGLALQMPNVVDWSKSDVDLSPLIPWLGNPDMAWPRKLARMFEKKWPELRGQLEVIRLEVEIIGKGYKWGDLYPIRAV